MELFIRYFSIKRIFLGKNAATSLKMFQLQVLLSVLGKEVIEVFELGKGELLSF